MTTSVAGNANILVITGTGANVSGTLSVSGKSNLGPASNVIITGGTSGYVLQTDGLGNLSWVAQSGGGGGTANIPIYDEGNLLTSAVSSINFVGSGVLATAASNAVTVTIPGNPSALFVDNFTGTGSQTAFTLSVYPLSVNNTLINIDGVEQLRSAYSVSGTTLTFTAAPSNGSKIEVTTVLATSAANSSLVTRSYTGNGVQNTFTVTNGVQESGILVTENGLLQFPTTDYTVSGTSLIFATPPANGIAIQVRELNTATANGTGPATATTDTFTGDGSTTSFALSVTPPSEDWTVVNYNGAILLKSDYSVANNLLTISSAPSNGSKLEVTTYTQLGG